MTNLIKLKSSVNFNDNFYNLLFGRQLLSVHATGGVKMPCDRGATTDASWVELRSWTASAGRSARWETCCDWPSTRGSCRRTRAGRRCCAWRGCAAAASASATTDPSPAGDFTAITQLTRALNRKVLRSALKVSGEAEHFWSVNLNTFQSWSLH